MKLIALIVGLLLERLVTHLLHLRELRWFDRYFDWSLARLGGAPDWARMPFALVLLALPVLPVVVAAAVLLTAGLFWNVPYFVFAVFVLLFSLGPRDLGEEVRDYVDTVQMERFEESQRIAKELLEARATRGGERRELVVEEAVLVQANNRIFGVVLYFVALGPVGAWLFRVSDMFRRRAVYEAERDADDARVNAAQVVETMHGVLAWLPARLTCLGYALAGSFEDAIAAWRRVTAGASMRFFELNDELIAVVGRAALAPQDGEQPLDVLQEAARAAAAMRLVVRTLFVWLTVVALMTLFGWAV